MIIDNFKKGDGKHAFNFSTMRILSACDLRCIGPSGGIVT